MSPPLPPTSALPAPTRDPRAEPSFEEQVDPELLALPNPPRRERTLTLAMLIVTAIASAAMVFALRRDALYAFAPREPVDVGDMGHFVPPPSLDNRFVQGRVLLGAAGSMRYERPFESDSYRIAPVVGRSDVWVEIRVPAGEENGRFVPPADVSGRLVRFSEAGPRHRGLARAIEQATGAGVSEGAWLVVDGEAPERARWAVALVLLFAGFAIWNLASFVRLVRRVR